METTVRVSPAESPVVAFQKADGGSGERFYEGVRLVGPDQPKLVALCDAVLFYIQVARLRTRPVTITEDCGCLTIAWSRYAPRVFAGQRLLELVAGGQ